MDVGLRIDVDTFRGTRDGVLRLLALLDKYGVKASFFFSVGPDNMGRHLWRLLKPHFLIKMCRSNAAALYGWDILLAGTAWPGRQIGRQLGQIMRDTDAMHHEIGLHAWDHHAWQAYVSNGSPAQQQRHIARGLDVLQQILGRKVDCSAVAGWRADQQVIQVKQEFGFRYNSDCRGSHIFKPKLADGSSAAPQIPVTLPTYDELIGGAISPTNYNDHLLSLFKTDTPPGAELLPLNVYTIHAEVEGIIMAPLFEKLLQQAKTKGVRFCPLGELLPNLDNLPSGQLIRSTLPGREGWLGCQA